MRREVGPFVRPFLSSILLFGACSPSGQVAVPTPTPHTTSEPSPQTTPTTPQIGCELELVGAAPHALEGQPVALAFACASGVDRTRFEARLAGAPAGAAFDAENWTVTWTPDLASAGVSTFTLGVKVAGAPSGDEFLDVDVSVADAWDDPANVPPDPATYTEEWGLPVFSVFPSAAIGQDYVAADLWYGGTLVAGGIKIRGAASAGYSKPSYTLDFGETQLDLGDLGFGTKAHLVLLTTFDDNSYVRQKLVYDAWSDLAAFEGVDRLTPRTRYVVVYLAGEYLGLYVALDHVDDEFVGQMGLDRTGNLYKAVSHDANFYLTSASGTKKTDLGLGYEKKEGDPKDWSDLDALVAWSAAADDATFAAEAADWLPVDEFGDWFLLVHHFSAGDSGGKNAYLYDLPSSLQFRYCPWDMNHSLGQDWTTARVPPDIYEDFIWTNGIFGHIERESGLSADLWSRYAAARGGPWSAAALTARVDEDYAEIDDEAARDWDKWEVAYRQYGLWSYRKDFTTYEEEKAYVYDWLAARDAYMASVHP